MSSAELTRFLMESLYLVIALSMPVLAVSLVVGFVVALVQAMTQVQDHTLAFVPKLIAVALALAAFGGWMGAELVRFTERAWLAIPALVL